MQPANDLVKSTGLSFSRRGALKLLGAGALSTTLAACSSSSTPSRSAQTLRIGLIVPQSGPLQEVGFEMANGFHLYLVLNGNQIAGMDAQVQTIDEGATTASGTSAVRTALKSNLYDVLVGIANSDVMAAISDDVTSARIPLLGSNGSPAGLRSSPFIWRTSFVAGEASTALAAYLPGIPEGMSQVGELSRPKSIAVYNDGTPDAIVEATSFTAGLGGAVTVTQVSGALGSVFNQIKSSQADLVYAATAVTNGEQFISAYRKAGVNKPLCGPGALTEQSKQPQSALHVFTAMNYAPDLNNSANATFTSAYFSNNNGKTPTTYAMTTYDAAAVLDVTITGITGDVTPLTINESLNDTQSIDSPRGRWQFNQGRTPLQQWYLRQVRMDGEVLDNRVLAELEALR